MFGIKEVRGSEAYSDTLTYRRTTLTLRETLDNQDYARAWNKEIKAGRHFYAASPLTDNLCPVEQFRTRSGRLEAKSEQTGRWLQVSFERVRRSA